MEQEDSTLMTDFQDSDGFFRSCFLRSLELRESSTDHRSLLFLFDEPASNLHAAAQQKLIESFPEIAQDEYVLAHSTHSHYMIESKWLGGDFYNYQ
jgi:predicted ATP-dependent endonuclease of OLD family